MTEDSWTDAELWDWLGDSWGTLAGCMVDVGHGDEWYWRYDYPDERPGVHGVGPRQTVAAAMRAQKA